MFYIISTFAQKFNNRRIYGRTIIRQHPDRGPNQ